MYVSCSVVFEGECKLLPEAKSCAPLRMRHVINKLKKSVS